MQMKKLVSFVAAAAMATAFCVPAFAEATPGGVAQVVANGILNSLAENWEGNKEEASALLKDMTNQLRTDSGITIVDCMNDAAVLYFDKAEENGDGSIEKSVGVEQFYGTGMVYRKAAGASDLVVNSFGYNDQGVITLDATEGSVPSEYGYVISITLPAEGAIYDTYLVSIPGGQDFKVDVDASAPYTDENGQEVRMITFWAPHFTTYQLTPVNVNNGGNEGGESNQGGEQTVTSDDNKEETTTSTTTTTTTVTENPIKATGVSMNMSVFAVVACAAVAACGAGVAVKKSHKGE